MVRCSSPSGARVGSMSKSRVKRATTFRSATEWSAAGATSTQGGFRSSSSLNRSCRRTKWTSRVQAKTLHPLR